MDSVSNFSSPVHRNTSNTQADPATNPTDSPCRQNLLEIPELRERIENNIVRNIRNREEKINYWLAWTIPTKKNGETFISLTGELLLRQRLLRHIEEAIQQRVACREEIVNKRRYCEDELAKSESREEKQEFRGQINALREKTGDYWKEIERFEEQKRECQHAIFRDASLRRFMVRCPLVFDTQHAKEFAYRYEQVTPHLREFEEYCQALRGLKKGIDSGAYTQDSQPSLEQINQKRKEMLRGWFYALLYKIETSSSEREYLASGVRIHLLADLPQPIEKLKNWSINQEIGVILKSLAEAPIKEINTVLKDLIPKLSSLSPVRERNDSGERRLVYEVVTRYLESLTEEAAKPILVMLALEDLKGLSYRQQERVFEKLKLYSPIELSTLLRESKLIQNLSFSQGMFILRNNNELTCNLMFELLRNNINSVKNLIGKLLLVPFGNDFEMISKDELKSIFDVILELFEEANKINYSISGYKTNRGGSTQFKFKSHCEDDIANLVEKCINKIPNSGISPLLIGLSNIWLYFSENNLIKLINLAKKYLPRVDKKEEVLNKMIENLGDSPTKTVKERSLIIGLIAPYLEGLGREEVPLSALIALTEKWKDLSSSEQLTSIVWIERYLSKNKPQKLIDAIRNNLNYLYKKEARPRASRLLQL